MDFITMLTCSIGLATDHVSRLLLSAEARAQSQGSSCGICGGQNGTTLGFSTKYFSFPLPIIIPLMLHSVISHSDLEQQAHLRLEYQ
jgi:hypothetical protein